MTRELVLGIDFGSSSTIAGVLVGDRIQLVQEHGDPVIPSVVYVPDRGAPAIGRRAVGFQLTEPSRVIRSVKRILGQAPDSDLVRHYAAGVPFRVERVGDKAVFKLSSGQVAPEQVVAWILSHVRDLAEARFGGRIRRCVMTMSAAAPPRYREAIACAAKIAHLEILDLVAEPIAGALALDLHTQAAKRRIVVCDFGGGTFDVSAVVQQNLAFTPVAAFGDDYLGGDDLDDAVAQAIAGLVFRRSRYDMHKDIVRWNELLLRSEMAKRQLTACLEAPLAMRSAYIENGSFKDLHVTLDRPWIAAAWGSLIHRVRGVVGELLNRAGWTPESVDVVGVIGGSSLVPMFRDAITELFGKELLIADQPELAVAQGATLLTGRHTHNVSDQIPILLDAADSQADLKNPAFGRSTG